MVTLQDQEKFHFIIPNLPFMSEMVIPKENKHLISKHLEVLFYDFHRTLDLCNGPLVKQNLERMFETETFLI